MQTYNDVGAGVVQTTPPTRIITQSPRNPGAIENALVISISFISIEGMACIALLLYDTGRVAYWREALLLAIGLVSLPFLILAIKKVDILATQLEREAWEHHRIILDLNMNGRTGAEEFAPQQPQIQVDRSPILVRSHASDAAVYSVLLDGTEVLQDRMLAFVGGLKSVGLTLDSAKRCELTREEWDSIIYHGASLGLWTAKTQGTDARPLVGREHAINEFLRTTG